MIPLHSTIAKDTTKEQRRVLSSISHIKRDGSNREEYCNTLPDEFFWYAKPTHASNTCSATLRRNVEE